MKTQNYCIKFYKIIIKIRKVFESYDTYINIFFRFLKIHGLYTIYILILRKLKFIV